MTESVLIGWVILSVLGVAGIVWVVLSSEIERRKNNWP